MERNGFAYKSPNKLLKVFDVTSILYLFSAVVSVLFSVSIIII